MERADTEIKTNEGTDLAHGSDDDDDDLNVISGDNRDSLRGILRKALAVERMVKQIKFSVGKEKSEGGKIISCTITIGFNIDFSLKTVLS